MEIVQNLSRCRFFVEIFFSVSHIHSIKYIELFSSPFLLTIITKDEGSPLENSCERTQEVRRSDISFSIEVWLLFFSIPIGIYRRVV